jgi:glycosyltransferase involved in cell wall biosynthesis
MSHFSTNSPIFSVIIPAYMADKYLGEAIQSVLNQTFPDFEVVIVNDASPDNTTAVVASFFYDSRIKYIEHPQNRGLPATRNTAVRASSGRYIALLDADDVFHPEKLQAHFDFLTNNPDVGVSYNSRFEIYGRIDNVRRLWIAPREVTLGDFVLGYPFAPSDIVVQRDWLFKIGLFHEHNNLYGEDLNTNCRLALAGCRFGYVERVLNYRRYYPSRVRTNLDTALLEVIQNLELVFNDPRCPRKVVELRDRAYAYNYSVWAYWAFAQNWTEWGAEWLRKVVLHDPQLMKNNASSLLSFLMWSCITDERGDLAGAMERIFCQLPEEFSILRSRYKWALGRALLIRGFEDVMWGRYADGQALIESAIKLKAEIDDSLVGLLAHQLSGYEIEFGSSATLSLVEKLKPYLTKISNRYGKSLEALYLVNAAFHYYRNRRYNKVPRNILRAWMCDLSHLTNRGVLSIFLRSIIRS